MLLFAADLAAAGSGGFKFTAYEILSKPDEMLFVDFDGDGLDDIATIDGGNLQFFFQDARRGFGKTAGLVFRLGEAPSLLWRARLREGAGEDVLVMTSKGVSSIKFVDRKTPPVVTSVIERETILPGKCREPAAFFYAFSARTAAGGPLVMVPTGEGLEVWRRDPQWRRASVLAVTDNVRMNAEGLGYARSWHLESSIGDVNNDGLDDVVVCKVGDAVTSVEVYLQATDGSLPTKPSAIMKGKADWRSWTGAADLNGDGLVDFVTGVRGMDPGIIPGTVSGKVIVRIFLAGADGKLPAEAQYLFRKSDWIASVPLVDIDGDGFYDLVLGYNSFDTREDIMRSLEAKEFSHSLRFHFYDGGFRERPDCQRDVTIHSERRGVFLSMSREWYLASAISVDGDFNGDGRRDLVVRDRSGGASVYFFRSRAAGFSVKADLVFDGLDSVERFVIADLNHDGASDLVVIGSAADKFKVFLSGAR
jgi:hypothetical protein